MLHSQSCRNFRHADTLNSEDHTMHRPHRYLASLFLTASLAAPLSLMAAPQAVGVQVRVYDRSHKDYHNWDDHENRAWAQFLVENHRNSHEYKRANRREQSEYWTWRHAHPDNR